MLDINKMTKNNIFHSGILSLGKFYVPEKHQKDFFEYSDKIIKESCKGFNSSWDFFTRFLFTNDILRVEYTFAGWEKIAKSLQGYNFLIAK